MRAQSKPLCIVAIIIYFPAMILVATAVIASLLMDVSVSVFMRDTTAVLEAPSYIGVVSRVGVLLWCASAAACLLVWGVLRHSDRPGKNRRFFLYAGLLTAALLIDDFFMVHETLNASGSLFSGNALFAGYAVVTAAFLVCSARIIARTNYLLLVLALLFLAASMGTDLLNDRGLLRWTIAGKGVFGFAEDVFKLLGIASWFGYFASESHATLVSDARHRSTKRDGSGSVRTTECSEWGVAVGRTG